ncbi:hypothetical protein JCM21900_004677 [Sporobolomyces salmonicolor]
MSDPQHNPNPFDQPYPADSSPRAQPPHLVIPESDSSSPNAAPIAAQSRSDEGSKVPSGTATSTSMMVSGSMNGSKSNRRVQWPADLARGRSGADHVSIPVTAGNDNLSPASARNLSSPGAQDELRRALERHTREHGTDDELTDNEAAPRYASRPPSEAPSGAASSDGDPHERLEALKDNMEVYVDPGETDGLPDARKRKPEERSAKAAWGLVRGLTSSAALGGSGLRRRNAKAQAGFKGGQGANADEAKKDEEARGEEGGERNTGRAFLDRLRAGNVQDVPPENQYSSASGPGGGGILSALIALQRQQQAASTTPSGATTPTSLGPSTRASSISGDFTDEEEEEDERLRFLAKLHEKRAQKNKLHQLSGQIGSGATGVAVGAGRAAGAGISGVGRAGGAVIGGAGRAGGAVRGGVERGVAGIRSKAHSKQPSAEGTGAPASPGEAVPAAAPRDHGNVDEEKDKKETEKENKAKEKEKDKKGLLGRIKEAGSSLGFEHQRPEAAKSGAGVFGGLMLGAANIAGAGAPGATGLGPEPSRPGYRLSRYSAPQIPTHKRQPSREPPGSESPETIRTGFSTVANSTPGTPPFEKEPKSPSLEATTPGGRKNVFSLSLKDLPKHNHKFTALSRPSSHEGGSPRKDIGEYFYKETEEEADRRAWEKEKRRRRKAREKKKAQEVFITQHVAAILERQQFIMKMARAFMMFGAPSHRLEAQMQATARVLEINCQVVYIPGVMMLSFGDAATHTSDIKFLKQANGLDLGKLLAAYMIYFNVIHDKISVTDASTELDALMVSPPKYKLWQQLIIGACASAFIQPSAFYGSFVDCLMAMPLGALLVLVQVIVSRNDLYSSLFEIVIACIIAFIAAALASTKFFCFAAVVSGSVVLILPGYIVLCGSLELANRSIISGSVRLVYSILYSLFLGFGLSIGSEIYSRATGLTIYGSSDYTCSSLRHDVPWYRSTIPKWWYFLTIPMYLLMLALRNGQPLFRKETILMVFIGSGGFAANFFSGRAFTNRSDISSAIGSFAVGFAGNLYGKFTRGSPFVVMVPGILIQLPSGLSNGGLLAFTSTDNNSTSSDGSSNVYSSGFQTAESLVQVAIGLTVGLFASAAIVNVFGGGRRRGSNLSSF